MVSTFAPDLWSIARHPFIEASALAAAMEDQVRKDDLDYRSRLLIRDGLDGLEKHWGNERLNDWLEHSPVRDKLRAIHGETFERVGFPSLKRQIMDFTNAQTIEELFRTIGTHLRQPLKLAVGGSIALILSGHLARATEDVDIVDEVPAELRTDYSFLESLKEKFGLGLAHFQSHYLPKHWEKRTQLHGRYDQLTVVLVDPIDIFLSKLFSARDKDYQDLRILVRVLDQQAILDRLQQDCQALWAVESERERAAKNWYTLTGDRLPL